MLATLIANAPELHFVQEAFHDNLQGLYYDIGDMHTLTLKIKEDIEFCVSTWRDGHFMEVL
jgi:hypothetical protein